ncbi:hypothetical protein GCM10023149_50430 [Mucilaginibacter gynuensis]|uniref:Helix-turn-helix domain-containing protein n=1 Tax=Mucilaginibacter gynuensis TaxID=1302236 RepID=A0ABP8HIG2_9SPHI
MTKITFEHVPAAIEQINCRLDKIEQLLDKLVHGKETEDILLTVQEAAAFLNLTVPTLYSKVSRMEIAVHKPGKRLYFHKKDLIEYLSTGKRKSARELVEKSKSKFRFEI